MEASRLKSALNDFQSKTLKENSVLRSSQTTVEKIQFIRALSESLSSNILSELDQLRKKADQTCHIQVDGSEICTYSGFFCVSTINKAELIESSDFSKASSDLDGYSLMDNFETISDELVVVSLFTTTEKPRFHLLDQSIATMPSWWSEVIERKQINTDFVFSRVGVDDPIRFSSTRENVVPRSALGPASGGLRRIVIRELPESLFASMKETNQILPTPKGETLFVTELPFVSSSLDTNRKINFQRDIESWISAFAPFLDAQRHNASSNHPNDGFVQPQAPFAVASEVAISSSPATKNRATYKVNNQWDLPAVSNIIVAGTSSTSSTSKTPSMPYFVQGFSSLVTSALHPQLLSQEYLASKFTHSNGRMLCSATGGGIVSRKTIPFSGRSDGWLARHYAYKLAGLFVDAPPIRPYTSGTVPTDDYIGASIGHKRFPARMVTILDAPYSSSWASMQRQSQVSSLLREEPIDPHDFVSQAQTAAAGLWDSDEELDCAEAIRAAIAIVADSGAPYRVVSREALLSMPFDEVMELVATSGIIVTPRWPAAIVSAFLPQHSLIVELVLPGESDVILKHTAEVTDLHYLHFTLSVSPSEKKPKLKIDQDAFKSLWFDCLDSVGMFSLQNPEWSVLAEKQGVPIPSYESVYGTEAKLPPGVDPRQ
jgi:hypothetical protein